MDFSRSRGRLDFDLGLRFIFGPGSSRFTFHFIVFLLRYFTNKEQFSNVTRVLVFLIKPLKKKQV